MKTTSQSIVFSPYDNTSKQTLGHTQVKQLLAKLASQHKIEGFSLSEQTGYWAGEWEKSYTWTVFDASTEQALKLASIINRELNQEATVVKTEVSNIQFVENQAWKGGNS